MINSFSTFTIGGDLTVNRLGYGAMRITGDAIWGPPKDRNECIRVLKRAIDLGVNFIDTADSYGPNFSEEIIAQALAPYPKDLVIATKGGLLRTGPGEWPNDGSPEHLRKAIESSLKRLKLDRIDLYQLHRIDPKVPAEKSFEYLKRAQQEGKIKHIGLSEVNVNDIIKAQQFFKVASVQNRYNVENRHWEKVLQFTQQHSIAFIPWFPLGGGVMQNQQKLKILADSHNTTIYQIALSWLLHHASNTILIPGTSMVTHLEENMKAADIRLSNYDMNILETFSKDKSKIYSFISSFLSNSMRKWRE